MATRKGICKNLFNCSKADSLEVQEVDEFQDFICAECKSSLDPISEGEKEKGGNSGKKKGAVMIGAVTALAVMVGAYLVLQEDLCSSIGKTDFVELAVIDTSSTSLADFTKNSLSKPENTEVLVYSMTQALLEGRLTDNKNGTGSINSPVGLYEGELIEGKASGNGTFKFYAACLLSENDPKKRVADEGDYISGQFSNNKLIHGKWFDKSGKQKASVIIGQAVGES